MNKGVTVDGTEKVHLHHFVAEQMRNNNNIPQDKDQFPFTCNNIAANNT